MSTLKSTTYNTEHLCMVANHLSYIRPLSTYTEYKKLHESKHKMICVQYSR